MMQNDSFLEYAYYCIIIIGSCEQYFNIAVGRVEVGLILMIFHNTE